MPNSFVLKANNGCETVSVIKNKAVCNWDSVKREMNNWFKYPFGYSGYEPHYLRIPPCIIAEELLVQNTELTELSPNSMVDFKFWCFNGHVECCLVTYGREKGSLIIDLYDCKWNRIVSNIINYGIEKVNPTVTVPKPKCLDKMREATNKDGRTVLYVSHNMNTIRKLCDRCIVLDKGKIVFNGDVDEAIEVYLGARNTSNPIVDLASLPREKYFADGPAKMTRLEIDTTNSSFYVGDSIKGKMFIDSSKDLEKVNISFVLINAGVPVMTSETDCVLSIKKGKNNSIRFEIDLEKLVPSTYTLKIILSQKNNDGGVFYLDVLMDSYSFEIIPFEGFYHNRKWNTNYTGYFCGDPVKVL